MIPIYIGISHRFDKIKDMTANSILNHTQCPVDISLLYPVEESGCTGFSNVRYSIEYGIYLDCDMIIMDDIEKLWNYRVKDKFVCMKDGSTEVAVIDCKHSCRNKREESFLPKQCIIPDRWNVEDYKYFGKPLPDDIANFHFTSLPHQPWFHEHPSQEAIEIYNASIQ